jgi:hypothetical protein
MSKVALIAALAVGLMGTSVYAASGPAPIKGQDQPPPGSSSGTMIKKHMGAKAVKHHNTKAGTSSNQ